MNSYLAEWLEQAFLPRSTTGLLLRLTLAMCVAWLVHLAFARTNPRWRVLTWRLAAAAIILLPFVAWLLPAISLRWLPAKSVTPIAVATSSVEDVNLPAPAIKKTESLSAEKPVAQALDAEEESAMRPQLASLPSGAAVSSDESRQTPAASEMPSWPTILWTLWLSGVAFGLFAEAFAWLQLRRLIRQTTAAPHEVEVLGSKIAARLGCRRAFEIRQMNESASPCVVGLRKAIVLLPASDCGQEQRGSWPGILAHEIAHIANGDLVWDSVLRWLSRGLWFHPLAWKMRSAHLAACDAVCDATAADYLGDVDSYGRLLAQMALRVAGNSPRPALPMARPSTVRQRIAALQQHVYASPVSRRWAWLAIAGCAVSLFCCAALSLARTQTKEHVDRQGDPLPVGAIARLGTTRYRYGGHEVIILPDGVTCLSRYMSGPIRVWDARNGKLIRDMSFADFSFEHMHVSPDGTLLGLFGYTRSPDHKSRVEVRVVRTDTGELVRSFPRETPAGNSLAFTADNKRVISMGADAIARVEDLTTGKEIAQHKFTVGGYGRVSVSPDGQWIGIVTGRGQCFTWDGKADSAPREHKLPGSMFDSEDETKLEFSPDSQSMVICDLHHNLLVLETSSGKLLQRLASAGELFNEPLDFSPDGSRLYTGCYSRARNTTRVWDTKTWREVDTIDFRGKLSPDGKLLVNRNRVLDLQQRKELNVDAGHDDTIWSLWPLSKERVLTGGGDGSIRAWNAATGEQLQRWDHEKTGWGPDISAIAVSPDDKYLLSAANDNTVRLWNLAEPKEVFRLPGHGTLGANFRALGFTAQGREFCSFGPDYRLRIYDTRRGKALHEFLLKPKEVAFPAEDTPAALAMVVTNAPALSADAKLLAVDYFDKIYVFDTFSGKVLQILEPKGGMMLSMRFSPDNTRLLAAPWGSGAKHEGRGAQLWDVKTGKLLQSIPTPRLPRACFSPDGMQIAVAVLDADGKASTLQIYTLDGNLTGTLAVPQQVSKLVFTIDGKAIVTAHHDGNALVWNGDAFVKPAAPQPKP